jgi:hypothetical protein
MNVQLDFLQETSLFQHGDDALARLEAVDVVEAEHGFEIV